MKRPFYSTLIMLIFMNLANSQMEFVQDINFGANSSSPEGFVEYNQKLYFIATNPSGNESIYSLDTNGNVAEAKSFNGQVNILKLIPLNGQFYAQIRAKNNFTNDFFEPGLWRINFFGTDEILKDSCGIGLNVYSTYVFNNEIYMSAKENCGSNKFKQLYAFNGTVRRQVSGSNQAGDFNPQEFSIHNNELYFRGFTEQNGYELYKTNGNSVSLAFEFLPGPASSFPVSMTSYNGDLYFGLINESSSTQLFKLNTSQSSATAFNISLFNEMVVFNNELYFAERNTSNNAIQLVKLDANDIKTTIPLTNPSENSTGILYLQVLDESIYFSASKPSTGYELYRYTPKRTSALLIEDYNPGSNSSNSFFRTSFNNTIYFGSNNGNGLGIELHRYIPETIDTTPIPDPNFEQALIDLGYDDVIDGEVITENLKSVTKIEIPAMSISDLTGIEAFTELQEFSLELNSVTSVDFSNNPLLREVTIYNNPLLAINLLENPLLTDLIISNTTGLSFSTIDISKNSKLESIDLSTNSISTLSLTNNPLLRVLRIGNNPINVLDLTQNTALEILSTYSTTIFSLDVSNNPNLTELIGYSGQLETLNLKNGNNTNLGFVDVSNNPNLECIEVDDPIVAQANTNWTKDSSPTTIYSLDCASDAILKDEERNALIGFYNATTGANWADNSNWLSAAPISIWSGITVNEFNRVKEIALANNNLKSVSPINLGNLSELEILSLINNDLSAINLSSFILPSSLTSLILTGNNITGNIPTDIGNLLNLDTLILSANDLDGSIPSAIRNLTNLEILFLQDNNLSGQLPQDLGNLNSLEVINLSNNSLSGTLPSNLSNPNLIRLFINFNEFTGLLPDFSNAPLEQLWIDNNFYDFSDIAPLVQSGITGSLQYSPQRTTDLPESIENGVGTTITLEINDSNINRSNSSMALNNQFQWFKDNTAITGANSRSYIINNSQESDSGIYYCEITNPLLPDLIIRRADIILTIELGLSVSSNEISKLQFYPNPVKDWLTIKGSNLSNSKAQFYDLNGRIVFETTLESDASSLNIEHLQNGVYVLNLQSKKGTHTQRVIKL